MPLCDVEHSFHTLIKVKQQTSGKTWYCSFKNPVPWTNNIPLDRHSKSKPVNEESCVTALLSRKTLRQRRPQFSFRIQCAFRFMNRCRSFSRIWCHSRFHPPPLPDFARSNTRYEKFFSLTRLLLRPPLYSGRPSIPWNSTSPESQEIDG
jgi:hypothetical protein